MAKPKVVGIISQKGGVGKLTLCQLIAREAAIGGKQAKILDFDVRQMTSTDWVRIGWKAPAGQARTPSSGSSK
jgi:cellulose biosynthesis protein BcsQ